LIYYSQIVGPYIRHLKGLNVEGLNGTSGATRAAIERLLSGERQSAADALCAVIAEGAPDAHASGALGFIAYLEHQGELALQHLERAVALAPDDANNLALLAVCYLGLERHAQALEAFRGALRQDPTLHVAHTLMWSAIAGTGAMEGAVHALKTALVGDRPRADVASASRMRVEKTTLCIVDCVNHALAERALRLCMAGCIFEEVKWLTDRPLAVPGVHTVVIPPIRSFAEYSRFMLKDLLRHVETEYALVVQWDGYIVNPQAWSPEFLLYDYIGARWDQALQRKQDHHDVGNGGFSLRSRALLEALQDPLIKPSHPEDAAICRIYRSYLEDRHGIVFAPDDVADRFSFEHIEPPTLPFGFHGVTNLARFAAAPGLTTLDMYFGGRKPAPIRRL